MSGRVNIVTLGCSKNLVDSEVLMAQLRAGGRKVVHEDDERAGDTVVINTCGFIDQAKDQSIQAILEYAERKRRGEIRELFVTGCLSQRYGRELKQQIPGVDGFFGTRENDLPRLLASLGAKYREELVGERTPADVSHYAYLKVSEGCNRGCSFCAIPLMRGKHASRPMDFLVDEAKFLVGKGVKEIMLIAQDLTYYGMDIDGERKLNELLLRLSDIDGLRWLRLHYAYPSGFPAEILPTIRERDNICNYMDMPVQHISDRVLKRMRRAINRKRTEELVNRIREEVPGIAIRTTVLVGHPGESEDDHAELMQFLDAFRFERLGVFLYSHEENTHSHTFDDDVDPEVKERRLHEVMVQQQGISLDLNRARIGQRLPVLIDGKGEAGCIGRTEHDSPDVDNSVLIDEKELHVGEFYDVEITGAREYDLEGRTT